MNKNAKAWVATLRSGRLKQGRNRLCSVPLPTENEDAYCCLGAACELYQGVTGDQIRRLDRIGVVTFDNQGLYLPSKVQEWLGLNSNTGHFDKAINGKGEHSGKVNNLAQCNDDKFTFAEIADIIESEPSGLFKD